MSGEDSEMMGTPPLPTGVAARMSSHGSQGLSATGTPGRISFKERLARGAAERQAKAMEGLTRADDWDSKPVDEVSNPETDPVVGSRSRPPRGGEHHESEELHDKLDAPQMFDDMDSEADGSYQAEDLEQGKDSLPLLPLKTKNEYVVLTPVMPSARDIYNKQMEKNKDLIESVADISDNLNASQETMNKFDKVIRDLKLIGDHQDLIIGHTDSQHNISHDTISKWALSCSPKCLFLKELFDRLRNHNINVAVLARPGMTLDILISILKSEKISYLRQDNDEMEYFDNCEMRVTLLPTGFSEGAKYVVSPVDAVIAFDWSFFEGEQYTTVLRSHPYDPNLTAPLVHLVTDQSAEHVDLVLSDKMDLMERKAYLAMFTLQQSEVGMHTRPGPEQAARPVANWLLKVKDLESPDTPKWPLNQNLDVYNLDIPDNFSQTQSATSTKPFSVSSTSSKNGQRVISNKRTREISDVENTKRMRMTPDENAPSSRDEVTQMPHSTPLVLRGGEHAGSPAPPGSANQWTFEQVIADRNERQAKWDEEKEGFFATISDLQAQLRSKADESARIHDLENQIRDKDDLYNTLREILGNVERKLEEHVDMVRKFEPKYKEMTYDKNIAVKNLAQAEERAETLSQRLEQRTNELRNAQEATNKAHEEIKAAKNQLISSPIPEIREFEELKQKLATTEEEKVATEKLYQNCVKDREFFQQQYQEAQYQAGKNGSEAETLRKENQVLQKKADENRVRIQKIQKESSEAQLVDQIDELKATVEDLKGQVTRKAEELKRRGDRSLRGTGAQSPMVGGFGAYGRGGV